MLHSGVGASWLPVKTVKAVGATKDLGRMPSTELRRAAYVFCRGLPDSSRHVMGNFFCWKNHHGNLPGLVSCYIAMERSTMLFMGKSTISMTMFNCYVSSPEGIGFEGDEESWRANYAIRWVNYGAFQWWTNRCPYGIQPSQSGDPGDPVMFGGQTWTTNQDLSANVHHRISGISLDLVTWWHILGISGTYKTADFFFSSWCIWQAIPWQ